MRCSKIPWNVDRVYSQVCDALLMEICYDCQSQMTSVNLLQKYVIVQENERLSHLHVLYVDTLVFFLRTELL